MRRRKRLCFFHALWADEVITAASANGVRDRAWRLARLRSLRGLYESYATEKLPATRAKRLLREWLSAHQNEQLDRLGYFEVVGSMTGTRYRIARGITANILELNDHGEPIRGLCFAPAGGLEEGDVMLAQKIALETCEAHACAVANWFPPKLSFPTRSLIRSRLS
jgi:hypothetical protein